MLRLMLLRHAKAEVGHGKADHARALNALGLKQAEAMGRYLATEGLWLDMILASNSLRTSHTAGIIQPLAGKDATFKLDPALYVAHPRTVLEAIHATPAVSRVLLVIGHNPGIAELAEALAGFGDRYAAARLALKYPPCGLTILDFETDSWQGIVVGAGRLERFIVPTDIGIDTDD